MAPTMRDSFPAVLFSMIQRLFAVCAIAAAAGCSTADRSENSAICGITMLASTARIFGQLGELHSALTEPPEELRDGVVPARAVGYGTSAATTAEAEDGTVAVTFSGAGFPAEPGFGAALVDDSSEVFRGILIWDSDPPPNEYPTIGTITDANTVMPLIGLRVNWGSVNSDRCPLFAELDSTTQ